ncbi:MAG: S-adenosylmethionine decarboxylase [Gammaproteobacteria bacterium]|nr:S-adenosylmethionine decarboxylase [Gammaproteobacteria bacterium]|tara:strand:- start:1197 stop:1595 length:399 start_codon:yes stop_codon:yes gene_type:complete
MSQQTAIWGQHLILDLAGCPREQLTSAEHIRHWVKELITAIDMKAFGEPVIEHFASHSFDAAGFTLMQLIETSNISAHFAENLGQVYIDIFSCKRFSDQDAMEVCRKYFLPTQVKSHSLERGLFTPALLQAV